MIGIMVAAALLASAQDAPPPPAPPQDPPPIALEDVDAVGRPLDRLINDFVSEVAEPNRHRGLARWRDQICVGVANLKPDVARYLADRISTVAEDIGLTPGQPGCSPNILIVATADAEALSRTLVERNRRAFRLGGAGMDRGGDALEDFVQADRPVRWWQMSMPVNSETGERAVRLPGECLNSCTGQGSALDYAPQTEVFAASRIRSQIVDDLVRAVVIVDVDEVSQLSILQLADYIAMVSLAQIDPDADTRQYASILNVMDDPGVADSLMDWDRAYLEGLYSAERNAANHRWNRSEIAESIGDAHQRLREARAREADAAADAE